MNLLDAKVIDTQSGLEVYVDRVNAVEVVTIHNPNVNISSFEVKLGINYFLLRERKLESRKKYFWIRLNDYNSSITLIEPKTESIFAVKNKVEREATKDLIGTWIIKTNTFNHAIIQQIQSLKKEKNIQTEDDIKKLFGAINSLKRLLQIKTEDIQSASIEQRYYTAI
jgi:hypothetical protein